MAAMTKHLLVLLLVFSHSVIAHAAPLMCKGQHLSAVETMICSDEKLSDYEEHLNILFHNTIGISNPREQRQVLDEQRLWITATRDRCDSWLCLHGAYQARINTLSQLYHERWKTKISGDVLIDLLRHSATSMDDRKKILTDCPKNQASMNFCSFKFFVKTDLAMNAVLTNKLDALSLPCRENVKTEQAQWEIVRDSNCNKEADDKAGNSSMRAMIYSTCQAEATEQRTAQLASLTSCENMK